MQFSAGFTLLHRWCHRNVTQYSQETQTCRIKSSLQMCQRLRLSQQSTLDHLNG